jgi:hypothetical protein
VAWRTTFKRVREVLKAFAKRTRNRLLGEVPDTKGDYHERCKSIISNSNGNGEKLL